VTTLSSRPSLRFEARIILLMACGPDKQGRPATSAMPLGEACHRRMFDCGGHEKGDDRRRICIVLSLQAVSMMAEVTALLRDLGWTVLRFWGHVPAVEASRGIVDAVDGARCLRSVAGSRHPETGRDARSLT